MTKVSLLAALAVFSVGSMAYAEQYETRIVNRAGGKTAILLVRTDLAPATPYALKGNEEDAKPTAVDKWAGPRHIGLVFVNENQ